jgi:hypothetical protein
VNPFQWERNRRVALWLAIGLGGIIGTVLGYALSGVAGSITSGGFGYYISEAYFHRGGIFAYSWLWTIFGAAVGGCLIYIQVLLTTRST